MKIISGGQTGVDIAGLICAKKHNMQTGGNIPKGFITLDGPKPEYKELYGMKETGSTDYPTRTAMNVKEADCTIWLGENRFSAGKLCTFKHIRIHKKPHKDIDINDPPPIETISKWIKDNEYKIINIAGNSQTKTNDIEKKAIEYLDELFSKLQT
jgi:hypothetical protein